MTRKEALHILNLNVSASEEEIRKAYKKMAQRYHPDNQKTQNEEMFIKAKEAYERLKDGEGGRETEPDRERKISKEPCPWCGGRGKRKIKRKTQRGFMVVSEPCQACGGTGHVKE